MHQCITISTGACHVLGGYRRLRGAATGRGIIQGHTTSGTEDIARCSACSPLFVTRCANQMALAALEDATIGKVEAHGALEARAIHCGST